MTFNNMFVYNEYTCACSSSGGYMCVHVHVEVRDQLIMGFLS